MLAAPSIPPAADDCTARRHVIVTRHAGARQWLQAQPGLRHAECIEHLDDIHLRPGDRVFGLLPPQLAASVCAQGAEYWALTMKLPPQARGRELQPAEMDAHGARLVRCEVRIAERGRGP